LGIAEREIIILKKTNMNKELEAKFKQIEEASKRQFESSLSEQVRSGYVLYAIIPLLNIIKDLANQNEELTNQVNEIKERVNQLEKYITHSLLMGEGC
jgi:hypothetical protein